MRFRVNLGGRTRAWLAMLVNDVVQQVLAPRRKPTALLTLQLGDGQSITGEINMQQLGDANFVTGTLTPIDSRGNPVPLDQVESIQFSGSDAALITVEQDPARAERFKISAVGALGNCQFQWQYDNLAGDGGDVIQGVVDIQIVSGTAVGAGVAFDEQQPQ